MTDEPAYTALFLEGHGNRCKMYLTDIDCHRVRNVIKDQYLDVTFQVQYNETYDYFENNLMYFRFSKPELIERPAEQDEDLWKSDRQNYIEVYDQQFEQRIFKQNGNATTVSGYVQLLYNFVMRFQQEQEENHDPKYDMNTNNIRDLDINFNERNQISITMRNRFCFVCNDKFLCKIYGMIQGKEYEAQPFSYSYEEVYYIHLVKHIRIRKHTKYIVEFDNRMNITPYKILFITMDQFTDYQYIKGKERTVVFQQTLPQQPITAGDFINMKNGYSIEINKNILLQGFVLNFLDENFNPIKIEDYIIILHCYGSRKQQLQIEKEIDLKKQIQEYKQMKQQEEEDYINSYGNGFDDDDGGGPGNNFVNQLNFESDNKKLDKVFKDFEKSQELQIKQIQVMDEKYQDQSVYYQDFTKKSDLNQVNRMIEFYNKTIVINNNVIDKKKKQITYFDDLISKLKYTQEQLNLTSKFRRRELDNYKAGQLDKVYFEQLINEINTQRNEYFKDYFKYQKEITKFQKSSLKEIFQNEKLVTDNMIKFDKIYNKIHENKKIQDKEIKEKLQEQQKKERDKEKKKEQDDRDKAQMKNRKDMVELQQQYRKEEVKIKEQNKKAIEVIKQKELKDENDFKLKLQKQENDSQLKIQQLIDKDLKERMILQHKNNMEEMKENNKFQEKLLQQQADLSKQQLEQAEQHHKELMKQNSEISSNQINSNTEMLNTMSGIQKQQLKQQLTTNVELQTQTNLTLKKLYSQQSQLVNEIISQENQEKKLQQKFQQLGNRQSQSPLTLGTPNMMQQTITTKVNENTNLRKGIHQMQSKTTIVNQSINLSDDQQQQLQYQQNFQTEQKQFYLEQLKLSTQEQYNDISKILDDLNNTQVIIQIKQQKLLQINQIIDDSDNNKQLFNIMNTNQDIPLTINKKFENLINVNDYNKQLVSFQENNQINYEQLSDQQQQLLQPLKFNEQVQQQEQDQQGEQQGQTAQRQSLD